MNCADFESIVNELADGRPMDATTRVNARSHATICGECAARLNDARVLNAGLVFAAQAETEEAPARVRESLLAAFAEHHHQVVAPASIQRSWVRGNVRWWNAAAVMAAAAVVILAVILPSRIRVAAPPTAPTVGVNFAPTPVGVTPAVTPAVKRETPVLPAIERKNDLARNTSSGNRRAVAHNNRPAVKSNEAVAQNTSNQYFPLTYLADATAMDSGTVVRIQLSRAALSRLGLPVSAEGADELLKADLVLGDDGVARAIRLVRE